jgi:hypothetical protein
MLHLRQRGSRVRPVVWQWSATSLVSREQMGQVPKRRMLERLRWNFCIKSGLTPFGGLKTGLAAPLPPRGRAALSCVLTDAGAGKQRPYPSVEAVPRSRSHPLPDRVSGSSRLRAL